MAEAVYILCAVTSGLCAVLLLTHYRRARVPLVLWTGVCFVGLTIANILLFVDLILVPSIDLTIWRLAVALMGAGALLYEMIHTDV